VDLSNGLKAWGNISKRIRAKSVWHSIRFEMLNTIKGAGLARPHIRSLLSLLVSEVAKALDGRK
ncbi:MAG: hypothetical protein ABSE95_05250, partial [Thermodesulfobacteriota bacterium]